MPNWFSDGICLPIHERLDRISSRIQDDPESERMIEQIRIILDSAGTERPPIDEDEKGAVC